LYKQGSTLQLFDGYEGGPSTKDNTHLRRTKGIIGPDVDLTVTGRFHGKKANFLSNERNKHKFIQALSAKMEKSNIKVDHATGDADLLIVKTAVHQAKSTTTVLVGDDTDLLVLLCFHAETQSCPIYLQPRPKPRQVPVS